MLEHWRDVRPDHDSVNAEREMMRRFFFTVIMVVVCATVAAADSYEDAVSVLLHGDHTRAVRLFRPLAEQGLASAQSHLGEMYRTGEGVTQDYQEALKWYRKAAEQGDAWAQYNLGLMYYFGQGIPQDYQEALKWYRQVAERGFARAQSNLGVMYDLGQGVPQDYIHAHMWYTVAAVALSGENGKIPKQYRDVVASRLTTVEIRKARAMARRCQKTKFKQCG